MYAGMSTVVEETQVKKPRVSLSFVEQIRYASLVVMNNFLYLFHKDNCATGSSSVAVNNIQSRE